MDDEYWAVFNRRRGQKTALVAAHADADLVWFSYAPPEPVPVMRRMSHRLELSLVGPSSVVVNSLGVGS